MGDRPFAPLTGKEFLIGKELLALSLYAGLSHRWTERLDSFVMLRFGAFAGDKVKTVTTIIPAGEIDGRFISAPKSWAIDHLPL
jgi:hypothetical protein